MKFPTYCASVVPKITLRYALGVGGKQNLKAQFNLTWISDQLKTLKNSKRCTFFTGNAVV